MYGIAKIPHWNLINSVPISRGTEELGMNSIKVETVRVHGGERFSFRSLMKTPNYGVATRTLRRGGYLQNYVRKFN